MSAPAVSRSGVSRGRLGNALIAAVVAAIAAELVAAAASGWEAPSGTLGAAVAMIALILPVLAYFLFASEQRGHHAGWYLIGVGLVFNSLGESYFYFAERTVSHFPTPGDLLCLVLFPPLAVGLIWLIREGEGRVRLTIGADGAVIALAIAAAAYEVIFNGILPHVYASTSVVGGALVYPILDLAALTMLAIICIPSRFRVGAAYFWLMTGVLVLLITDVSYLRETTTGSLAPTTGLYVGWALAVLILSNSSRFDASLIRSDAFRGPVLNIALGGAMLFALALLLQEAAQDQDPVVIAASAAALLLSFIRLFGTLAENARLIRERDEVIARQRELQARLSYEANHDPLTGLCNRRRFAERVAEQLRYARRYEHPGALLLVDLDSFKFINDSFGHPTGDRVIQRVATAIRDSVRETDTAARLGGDEFAVLLPETDEAGALRVAESVLGAIKRGGSPRVGGSAGIVVFGPERRLSAEDLFIAADIALYEAKDAGHGRVSLYHGQRGMKLTWVDRIRAALREGRLVLYAQPIVDLRTGEVAWEELLVRMIGRDGSEIPPSSFLPTAERFGLIGDIDRLAVDQAIELACGGRAVAVNISGPTLTDRGLIDRVAEAIREGMSPELLSFELTETTEVANIEAARNFAGFLENMGCSLALDDFGTGVSSLRYLKKIPIQTLKIDAEFVRGMRDNTFDRYLVQTIVSLARRLGQQTVAEGVEDEATLSLVRMFGIDYAQGFLLGDPAPIDPAGPPPLSDSVRATLSAGS
ncbi:MAG TPA: EAL domain-containing protein [Solirubrobacterales bacterium]